MAHDSDWWLSISGSPALHFRTGGSNCAGILIRRQKESITRFLDNDFQNLNEVSALLQYATKASMLKGFDGDTFKRFVERVIVYSRSEIGFEFKCGITLKERLVR